jgi:hypothetical protein
MLATHLPPPPPNHTRYPPPPHTIPPLPAQLMPCPFPVKTTQRKSQTAKLTAAAPHFSVPTTADMSKRVDIVSAGIMLLSFLASAVAALPISSSIYALPVHSNSSQNSPAEAVALAASYYAAQTDIEPYLCDHYVGFWYGHDASGWPSAIDQWNGAAGQTRAIGISNTRYMRFCRNPRRQEVGRMDLWRAGVLRWRPVWTRRNLRGG